MLNEAIDKVLTSPKPSSQTKPLPLLKEWLKLCTATNRTSPHGLKLFFASTNMTPDQVISFIMECCGGMEGYDVELEIPRLALQLLLSILSFSDASSQPCLPDMIADCAHFNILFPLPTISVDLRSLCSALLSRVLTSDDRPDIQSSRFVSALLKQIKVALSYPTNTHHQIQGLLWTGMVCDLSSELGKDILSGDGVLDHLFGTLEYDELPVIMATLDMTCSACSRKELRPLFEGWSGLFLTLMRRFSSHENDTHAPRLKLVLLLCKLLPSTTLLALAKTEGKEWLEFLISSLSSNDKEIQTRDAVEVLIVLSLMGDFKERITATDTLIGQLIKCAHQQPSLLYGVCLIFANLARFPPTLSQEQRELARLKAMQTKLDPSQPASMMTNEYDDRKYVEARCRKLVDLGALRLFSVPSQSWSMSPMARETAARFAVDLATIPALRGKLVQEGVVKCLLSILFIIESPDHDIGDQVDTSSSARCLIYCAHALAKIAISMNPHLAFKDNSIRLIRPFLILIESPGGLGEPEGSSSTAVPSGLIQFEGLMALTNLASMSEETKSKIEDLGGVKVLEGLLSSSSNPMICTASMEALCNMIFEPRVFHRFTMTPKGGDPSAINRNTIPLVFGYAWNERMESDPLSSVKERGNELKMAIAATGILAILSQSGSFCQQGVWRDKLCHLTRQKCSQDLFPEIAMRLEAIRANLAEHGIPFA